jgi:hypothetical protein
MNVSQIQAGLASFAVPPNVLGDRGALFASDFVPSTDVATKTANAGEAPALSEKRPSMPSARMSFDIGLAGNSLTVTLSDRNSGEVFLKLVYDDGGLVHSSLKAHAGQLVDVVV